ncbi:Cupin domain-containing protein [Arcicella aurantiaca]|uniref:Cupin domain-containing protein n=1 Tax=Arcicella aurantiaca TaxID=591202 RepID=A0A316EAY7_9BACT|nr:cupin domain-containing protein [Arcicella aurantiaca]PWK27605.1 Cupin domain-containing protein [Arcicella aurantiaca]
MIEITTLPEKEIVKGFVGKFIHTDTITLGYWDVEEGATLPLHSHFHEQITTVIEGKFELTIGDETKIYENGLVAVIPPNVVHGGKALTDCKLLDVFSPVREDYKF